MDGFLAFPLLVLMAGGMFEFIFSLFRKNKKAPEAPGISLTFSEEKDEYAPLENPLPLPVKAEHGDMEFEVKNAPGDDFDVKLKPGDDFDI